MLPALIFSNAWVSFCVALFSLPYLPGEQQSLQLLWPVFIYLNTFLGYAFLHRTFLTQKKLSETNLQAAWIFCHRLPMSIAIALHALALFLLVIWYGLFSWQLYALPAVVLVLLYKLEINKQEKGLRSRAFIKPLSVSAATVWICCVLPAFLPGTSIESGRPAEAFSILADFLFVAGIALLFDAHDVEEDKSAGISTLIQRIGTRNIPVLVVSLCLASCSISIISAFSGEEVDGGTIFASCGMMLISSVMLLDRPLQRKEPDFGFWFDGLIGLKGFLFFAFS